MNFTNRFYQPFLPLVQVQDMKPIVYSFKLTMVTRNHFSSKTILTMPKNVQLAVNGMRY